MNSRIIALSSALLLLAAVAAPVIAQPDIEYSTAIAHALTPPLRDIVIPPAAPTGFNVEIPIRLVPGRVVDDRDVTPPNLQLEEFPVAGASLTPPPILNFQGQSDDENASTVGGRIVPPDTDGDVGATQYLQWINLIASVYDKTTGVRTMGPTIGNAFFSGLGFPCATTNNGDPIVLYDQKNNRWMVSQFAPNSGIQCIAVSTTSDATGSYNAYAFVIGGFNDYPKLGLWLNDQRDVLSATYRNFGGPGGGFSLDFQVIDYAVMLAGGPSPGSFIVRGGSAVEGCLPADVDGNATYAATEAAMFGCYEFGSLSNGFLLWRFDGNFPGGGGVFTPLPTIAHGPIDRIVGRIPQPAPGEPLDSHATSGLDATMFRLPYRNFGTHQQILATTTVDVGGDRAGKHFLELRNTGGGWTFFQEGSYAPGAPLERWMGSIAADADGNIALGYSTSSSGSNPSVRYTSRTPSDPLGTLPGGEIVARPGGGVQISSSNRWGDYSSMTVDPVDDCTFWYTQEYYANTNSFDFKTNINNFKFSGCGGPPPATPTLTQTGGSCPGTVSISGSNFTPNTEVPLVGAANLNGFVKGGVNCGGVVFEIGEPFNLPPTFAFANASGSFSVAMPTVAGRCFVESLDQLGTCQTSNAINTSP